MPSAVASVAVAIAFGALLAVAASGAGAQPVAETTRGERDPPVPAPVAPAGPDDGAVRVALVDSGVNYTLPAIARALARDADGALVGHDFRDLDPRPFDRHVLPNGRVVRHGTRTASVLVDEAPRARLVPYRFPQTDMSRMEALVEHAAANDVRVVGLPLGGPKRAPWDAFERAARAHPDLLFVASAGNDGRDIDAEPVWPAALSLDNLVVVTSADDFGRLATGVNRGRTSVDYLVPAEHVPVLHFDGSRAHAAGSSYAVPRVVALAARLLEANPAWRAPELVAELRRRFADGSHPRDVGGGVIADPLAVGERAARVVAERVFVPPATVAVGASERAAASDGRDVRVPLDVLVPNAAWERARVDATLARAAEILAQCALHLAPVRVLDVDAPERLADLSVGGARTLFDAVRASGAERRVTVVLARDTRMRDAYDGEAFGRANTRYRPWLADSVWLTAPIRDAGIALAHELFHVLANSGAHDDRADNLMRTRTRGDNVRLEPEQCEAARRVALASGTAVEREG